MLLGTRLRRCLQTHTRLGLLCQACPFVAAHFSVTLKSFDFLLCIVLLKSKIYKNGSVLTSYFLGYHCSMNFCEVPSMDYELLESYSKELVLRTTTRTIFPYELVWTLKRPNEHPTFWAVCRPSIVWCHRFQVSPKTTMKTPQKTWVVTENGLFHPKNIQKLKFFWPTKNRLKPWFSAQKTFLTPKNLVLFPNAAPGAAFIPAEAAAATTPRASTSWSRTRPSRSWLRRGDAP